MSNVKFEIKGNSELGNNGVEKYSSLEISDANDNHVAAIIAGLFGVFGVDPRNNPVKTQPPTLATGKPVFSPSVDLKAKQQQELAAAKQEVQSQSSVSSRPRAIELRHSKRTLSVPLGEKLSEAAARDSEQTEWFKTGIKYKDGIPHYRTRYWCKQCGNQGNQYVKLTDRTTECHECGAQHLLRPAIGSIDESGIPDRDDFGNYFRADKLANGGNK